MRKANIPTAYQRAIVQYHRKEAPGSIVVDTDARYLYYVLPDNRAIRYGVTVGEDALSWYGIAKVGRKEEWPSWTPTADIKKRLDVPNFVEGGAHNPMGARGIYLFQAARTRLFRIHGTNQPEYIGQAISSGCIRMTNEDVIDLYNRVKMGSIVVVLAAQAGRLRRESRRSHSGDPTQLKSWGAGSGAGRKFRCRFAVRVCGAAPALTRLGKVGLSEAFALDPIERAVERAAQTVEDFVDFSRRDDQRRTQRQHIADEESHDQPLLFGEANGARSDSGIRIERAFGLLVGDQLDGADEP